MTPPRLDYREVVKLLLWAMWGLALALVVSASLWGVFSAAGDEVGGHAARLATIILAIVAAIDLAAIVVTLARRELD